MPSWHGAQLKHRDNFTFFTTSSLDRRMENVPPGPVYFVTLSKMYFVLPDQSLHLKMKLVIFSQMAEKNYLFHIHFTMQSFERLKYIT